MTYDGSDRKQVRRREKEAAIAQANRVAYTRRIMADQPGREWMHDLLERCNVFHTPFVRGAVDVTSFNCGIQNIGLALFADVVAFAPTEYVLMMQEANVKELLNERRNSDQRSPAAGERSDSTQSGRVDQGSIVTEYDPFGDSAEDGAGSESTAY